MVVVVDDGDERKGMGRGRMGRGGDKRWNKIKFEILKQINTIFSLSVHSSVGHTGVSSRSGYTSRGAAIVQELPHEDKAAEALITLSNDAVLSAVNTTTAKDEKRKKPYTTQTSAYKIKATYKQIDTVQAFFDLIGYVISFFESINEDRRKL